MTNFKDKLSTIKKIITGQEPYIGKQASVKTKWFGNRFAGFYVATEQLNSSSIVYSFGVGEDISFDQELIAASGCTVFGFDPTPKSIDFIKSKGSIPNYSFTPIGLYKHDGSISFYLPANPNHVSCTVINRSENEEALVKVDVPVKKFSSIVAELGHKKIDVLKMDIEGSEYEVLDDVLSTPVVIPQILIEFHHRFAEVGKEKTIEAIAKLKRAGYKVAKVSDTNEEVTFVKMN